MTQHTWVPSRLGHGEAMCSVCYMTNREAMVLGMQCNPLPATPKHNPAAQSNVLAFRRKPSETTAQKE
jgi:hypothetical protein